MKGKISALNKTLVALYAILGAALTVLVAAALYAGAQVSVFGYELRLAEGFWPCAAVAVVGLAMLYWSYRLILIAFDRHGDMDKSSVSINNTENGDVRISMQAMDSLVKRAIGDMSGIASIKTHVLSNDDSISVEVSMALESDVHIPNTTMLLQRTVKNFIEEYSGIAVRDVTVIVTSVADPIVVPKQLAIETLPKRSEDKPAQADTDNEYAEQPKEEPKEENKQEPEREPERKIEPETEPEPEDESKTKPAAQAEPIVKPTPEPIKDSEQTQPDASQAGFVLSDGLPDIDSFLGSVENVDYNFSQSPDSGAGDAEYYSPYGESSAEGADDEKK